MIKLSVEVRSGAARFDVAVQAESIQRALSLVTRRHPGSPCRVKFPLEAEDFFVTGSAAREELVGPPQRMAA
jgi:hypothetical protein